MLTCRELKRFDFLYFLLLLEKLFMRVGHDVIIFASHKNLRYCIVYFVLFFRVIRKLLAHMIFRYLYKIADAMLTYSLFGITSNTPSLKLTSRKLTRTLNSWADSENEWWYSICLKTNFTHTLYTCTPVHTYIALIRLTVERTYIDRRG